MRRERVRLYTHKEEIVKRYSQRREREKKSKKEIYSMREM